MALTQLQWHDLHARWPGSPYGWLRLPILIPERVTVPDARGTAESYAADLLKLMSLGLAPDLVYGYARVAARCAEIVLGDQFTGFGQHIEPTEVR